MFRMWAIALAVLFQGAAFGVQAADKVELGQVISLAQAPYYVAIARGYMGKEGIEIDSGNFRGGQDMVSSLATGQLDIGLGAFNAGFFNAANKGLDMRAVAALGSQPKAKIIATPPLVRTELWDNGTIRSGKDFRGRKIAVNTPGATPEFTLSLILEKYGMTLKDVDETMIGFPQMVIALANKSVDVAFVTSPFHAIPLRDKTAVILEPDANVTAGDITTVVFFSGKFIRERPQVGERFLRALVMGAKETQGPYNKNPEIAELLAKGTGLKLQDIVESHTFAFDPHLDINNFRDSIRRQETQHKKDGRIDYTGEVPMDKMIDPSLIKKAMASAQ